MKIKIKISSNYQKKGQTSLDCLTYFETRSGPMTKLFKTLHSAKPDLEQEAAELLKSYRARPSIKMRQTIKWCLTFFLKIVWYFDFDFHNLFWNFIKQSILAKQCLFCQAISLLPNIYFIGNHHNNNHWEFGGGKWRPWGQRVEKVPQGINGSKNQCCGSLRVFHNSKLPGC